MGYYVTRNAQGDICAIYNRADNTLVGTYQYDTWGNILSITPAGSTSDPNNILQKNPFRYRGYYYDNESGHTPDMVFDIIFIFVDVAELS